MGMLLTLAGGICGLVSFVCFIIILIAAFQEEVVQGILCLCVPCYVFYYAFARFEHEQKNRGIRFTQVYFSRASAISSQVTGSTCTACCTRR